VVRVRKKYGQSQPYVTKDGSVIRELIHPDQGSGCLMSLAEATVHPGGRTLLHLHHASEEIYHVLEGTGCMSLGGEVFSVDPGDSVLIRPGTPHRIENIGEGELVILCCCSPAYAHDDTLLLEEEDRKPVQ
jgi:mannose-6-phosphate isomerase-like protein (cupin superfamily)